MRSTVHMSISRLAFISLLMFGTLPVISVLASYPETADIRFDVEGTLIAVHNIWTDAVQRFPLSLGSLGLPKSSVSRPQPGFEQVGPAVGKTSSGILWDQDRTGTRYFLVSGPGSVPMAEGFLPLTCRGKCEFEPQLRFVKYTIHTPLEADTADSLDVSMCRIRRSGPEVPIVNAERLCRKVRFSEVRFDAGKVQSFTAVIDGREYNYPPAPPTRH